MTVTLRVLDQDVRPVPGENRMDGVEFPARVEVWVPDEPGAEEGLTEALRAWSAQLRGMGQVLAEGGRFTVEQRGGGPARVFTGMVVIP